MQDDVEKWLEARERKILAEQVEEALQSVPEALRDAVRKRLVEKLQLRRWEHGGFYGAFPFSDEWLPLDRAVLRLMEDRDNL